MNKNIQVLLVNENDEIIGSTERLLVKNTDLYRVSALWIQNSNGEILLAQRSFNKKNHPGKWGPAVAGTVEEGETYESNIMKEAEEEIGLRNCEFTKAFKEKNIGKHSHFTQWFSFVIDKRAEDFTVQQDEVAQIKWFTRAELLRLLETKPDDFLRCIKRCVDRFSKGYGSKQQ